MSKEFEWTLPLLVEFIEQQTPDIKLQLFKEAHSKPQQEPNTDWEVIAYACKYGGKDNIIFHLDVGNVFRAVNFDGMPTETLERIKEGNGQIYKVRRKSDGETFSIGDEVIQDVETRKNTVVKIISFTIIDGIMVAVFERERCPLQHLKKQSPPQVSKERIEVEMAFMFPTNDSGAYYHFHANKPFDRSKLPLIKQAIEKILNHE